MSGHRKTALVLHGLQQEDRAWLLAQMGEADRLLVEPLLAELAELGIPADASLLGALPPLQDNAAGPAFVPLAHALENEPAPVLAAVLALRDWPWRDALLARLDGARRAAVLARAGVALAPRLRAALELHLDDLAAALPAPIPAAAQPAVRPRPIWRAFPWLK